MCRPSSQTHVVGINDEFDDVARVGGERADGRFRNEIFQLLKETQAPEGKKVNTCGTCLLLLNYNEENDKSHVVYLVNRLELLGDGKDGLDVVITQFLNQMGDGRVVLSKDPSTQEETNTLSPKKYRLKSEWT